MKQNTALKTLATLAFAGSVFSSAIAQVMPQKAMAVMPVAVQVASSDLALSALVTTGRAELYAELNKLGAPTLGEGLAQDGMDLAAFARKSGAGFILQPSVTGFEVKKQKFFGLAEATIVKVFISTKILDGNGVVFQTVQSVGESKRYQVTLPAPFDNILQVILDLIRRGSDQPATALKFAIKNAAKNINAQFASLPLHPFGDVVASAPVDGQMNLHLTGWDSLSKARAFLKALALVEGIKTATLDSYKDGVLTAKVGYDSDKIKDLSELLEQTQEGANYKVQIEAVSKEAIEGKVSIL